MIKQKKKSSSDSNHLVNQKKVENKKIQTIKIDEYNSEPEEIELQNKTCSQVHF